MTGAAPSQRGTRRAREAGACGPVSRGRREGSDGSTVENLDDELHWWWAGQRSGIGIGGAPGVCTASAGASAQTRARSRWALVLWSRLDVELLSAEARCIAPARS